GIADIHVWTIISDPRRDASRLLMVNFTTWAPNEDQACVLEPGAHPFIIDRTCVNYPRSRTTTNQALEQLKTAGRLELLAPLSAELLRRVREGAMDSTRMALELA